MDLLLYLLGLRLFDPYGFGFIAALYLAVRWKTPVPGYVAASVLGIALAGLEMALLIDLGAPRDWVAVAVIAQIFAVFVQCACMESLIQIIRLTRVGISDRSR